MIEWIVVGVCGICDEVGGREAEVVGRVEGGSIEESESSESSESSELELDGIWGSTRKSSFLRTAWFGVWRTRCC